MVEIAVEKLRGFCEVVTIAGNQEGLERFGPVVRETRVAVGPAAGVEAGLAVATEEWAMFIPVDVPLVPEGMLRRWAETVLAKDGLTASYLHFERDQPAFCMLRRECGRGFSAALEGGERRLGVLLERANEGLLLVYEAGSGDVAGRAVADAHRWFANVNTPEDLVQAEAWALEG